MTPGTVGGGRRVVVAIDLGGTVTKARAFDTSGATLAAADGPTPERKGRATGRRDDLFAHLAATVEKLTAEVGAAAVAAIGVAAPGIVDDGAGVVRGAVNLAWRAAPVGQVLRERFGVPVAVANDVRAGGLAEWRVGRGGEAGVLLFVPIGTGVAAALVAGGSAWPGSSWQAGEIGHVVTVPGGEPCACGQRGCLEVYASAAGIARRYEAATGTSCTAQEIAGLLAHDEAAASVWADATTSLGSALAAAVALADPDVVVLGGGLAQSGCALVDAVSAHLRAALPWRSAPPVEQAILGPDAGVLGASLLARELLDEAAG